MTFSSPVVANSHYLGKTHAKNLKLKQQSPKTEGMIRKGTEEFSPGIVEKKTSCQNSLGFIYIIVQTLYHQFLSSTNKVQDILS